MANREVFLARLREQTAKGRAHRVALNPQATAEAAYVGGGLDPAARLIEEWIAVGGRGARVAGIDGLREYLTQLVQQFAVQRALRWRHPLLERLGVDSLLVEAGVEVRVVGPACRAGAGMDHTRSSDRQANAAAEQIDVPPGRRDLLWDDVFAADLGITSVDFAVAETGTLALCSTPGQGRVVSLLPPVYLAIIEPSQIVPDLFDLFAALESRKTDLPSNIALVTGPSKTGDIELKLTTGVHGPGEVHLVVVE